MNKIHTKILDILYKIFGDVINPWVIMWIYGALLNILYYGTLTGVIYFAIWKVIDLVH